MKELITICCDHHVACYDDSKPLTFSQIVLHCCFTLHINHKQNMITLIKHNFLRLVVNKIHLHVNMLSKYCVNFCTKNITMFLTICG